MEAMGSGVAVFDFHRNGLPDLYFVNGADLSQAAESGHADKTAPRFWNRLYRNQVNWHFEDSTVNTNSAGREYGMGVTTADYDADGNLDLFITGFGPDILYRNKGNGTFQDVSEEAGIYGEGWSSGATFLDYDGDEWLDLFVAGYLDWSFENNQSVVLSCPRADRTAIQMSSGLPNTRFTVISATDDSRMFQLPLGWILTQEKVLGEHRMIWGRMDGSICLLPMIPGPNNYSTTCKATVLRETLSV